MERPLVMTSGNLSEEPQVIDDAEAREKLAGIAAFALVHDREIANRRRRFRRAGHGRTIPRASPRPRLCAEPDHAAGGICRRTRTLAMGGELKATFCLVKDGQAILSQHMGDLENAATFDDYRKSLALYRQLFAHEPAAIVVDRHPEYLSTKLGHAEAGSRGLPLLEVQHHHAHVAACLAENGYPLEAPAVLGIVLDGLGLGDDGTIWGGEFLLADYRGFRRLARCSRSRCRAARRQCASRGETSTRISWPRSAGRG